MNFYSRRINLYLTLLLAAILCGCGTFQKKSPEKVAAVRIHLEAPVSVPDKTKTVTLLRNNPVVVTVDEEPVLTEQNLLTAELIETPGGFAVRLQFDETGGWILEQASASNPGKHFVIFGQWGEKTSEGRFLAIPLITTRNATGSITFTPDADRDEAQKFVDGLNALAKLIHTPQKK